MVTEPTDTNDDGRTVRAWIVEDEAQFRESLAFLVGRVDGLNADRTFADAEAALAALEAAGPGERPGLVLMDVNLPGMSGVEATARVRALAPEARVVVLTVRDEAATIFAALRAGASGYLLKGEPIDRILAAIREALAGGVMLPAPVAREVLGFFAAQPSAADYGLSERERAVLELMVEGLAQKEIAGALFVTTSTVNKHVQRVYEKLHVHTAPAAVAKAIRERLV